MAVKVALPTHLASLTNGYTSVVVAGSTIAEVIDDLGITFPGIKERIVDGSGSQQRSVKIYVDDEDIRSLHGLATPTSAETRVTILAGSVVAI